MKASLFSVFIAGILFAHEAPHIKAALSAYETGTAAASQHHIQAAIDSFRTAIRIEPTFLEAHRGLIDALLDSKRALEAAAAITRFLEIEPDAKRYRLKLGEILLNQNQAQRALAQFSILLQSDADNADALLGFARAAKQAGMSSQALDALKRGAARYPSDQRFKRGLNSH